MKILFFINQLYGGGAERVATTLLNHFCEKHDTYVAVLDFNNIPYPLDTRVTIINDRIKSKIKGASRIPRFLKMAHTIKKINPDIVISFITQTNVRALAASLLTHKKIIVSERNSLNRKIPTKEIILRKLLYPFANKIVFVSAEDSRKFNRPQKSLVIYNPATFEPYSNYDNREKSIATIGPNKRWRQKGLDILMEAWEKIAEHNPNWNLEIYGRISDIVLPDSIAHKKQTRVSWNGWCENIAEILRSKSIFVLASRFEGCPNSLIEAMNQGCACLATNCDGGSKEIIDDGVNGLIAISEDADDIATKLQMLIDNEELRRRLSAGAILKMKQFDKNAFFAKWDKLIEDVAGK